MTAREPITIVELVQPRCALRFGVGACTATGTPKCYNTPTTCHNLAEYTGTGRARWRFCYPNVALPDLHSVDGEDYGFQALPVLVSHSTSSSKVNISAAREGESPFGVLSWASVVLQDMPWDDLFGDFYRGDRENPARGTLLGKWTARNAFYSDMFIRIYEGFVGDMLPEMSSRLYAVETVTGPDSSGRATIKGMDPLRLAEEERAMFPRTTNLQLYGDIDATTTAVSVYGRSADDLTDVFGNTALKYAILGDEIVGYADAVETGAGTGIYLLSGVVRGKLGTAASTHSDEDAIQRVGRYDRAPAWEIQKDLFENHTPLPHEFIPYDDWVAEASTYMPSYQIEGTVITPTAVGRLSGELIQQCNYFLWWADRAEEIRLRAVRPPKGAVRSINEGGHIVGGSAAITRDAKNIYTRVYIHYGVRDPTASLTDPQNYRYLEGWIDADAEMLNGGQVRELVIYSRWLRTRSQALLQCVRLLQRYAKVQRYLAISLDFKDADIDIPDELDVQVRLVTDTEGAPLTERWQVITIEDLAPGHRFRAELQEYVLKGRFASWQADDAPVFSAATPTQILSGGWFADDEGKMSDGTKGFGWQ